MLLQHLITFSKVIDEGSFTRAAERLNLSQPAVTKQVKGLEEDLGVELIERFGRELSLTPAGEVVYAYAKRITDAVRELHASLEGLTTPGRGHLTVAAVLTLVLFTLPSILGAYAKEHPLVTVHVHTGTNQQIQTMVLRNEIDVGLITVPIAHEQIDAIPLFRDRVLLVSSPTAAWAVTGTISPTDLSKLPMISYQKGSRFRGFVDTSFEEAGITPDVVMEFDSHEAVKTMTQLGFGVAMLPETAVQEDLAVGRLVALSIEGFPEISRITSLIMRRDRPKTPAVSEFLALLRRWFPTPPNDETAGHESKEVIT